MPKVIFQIEGASEVTVECNTGDNLLEVARRANVAIDAPCGGNGSCGKCRVQLIEGDLESPQSRHISEEEYQLGWRLSCCSKVMGDCKVMVPDIASAYQSRMKTADLSSPKEIVIFENCQNQLKESGIHFVNCYRSAVLQLSEPTLEDTMPDAERLTWAIEEAFGVENVKIPFAVMVKMAHTLRENNWNVCVKGELKNGCFSCMEITAPTDTAVVGCAIDIGTTTVTMVLTDLESGKILAKGSSGNGQIHRAGQVRWPEEAPGCHHQRNPLPHHRQPLCQRQDFRPQHSAAVHRCQHHHEPPVCGRGCRACAHGALCPQLLPLGRSAGR